MPTSAASTSCWSSPIARASVVGRPESRGRNPPDRASGPGRLPGSSAARSTVAGEGRPRRLVVGVLPFGAPERADLLIMRILIVEDEVSMARSLTRGLSAEGYTVDVALDGQDGLNRATTESYDAIILDLMLPKINGYAVTAALREQGVRVPVLMLTAKQGEFDQTEALDTGADDFLSKPFSYPVLLARVRALIRRGGSSQGAVLAYGDIRLDTREHRC